MQDTTAPRELTATTVPEGLAILRAPFADTQIQCLPKPWCRACSQSREKHCQQHEIRQCRECGNRMTTAHVHLDYVGHAELTNRLLDADLMWDWEPVATDERGLPAFDAQGGLWIRLTVCGVTRLGYGDAQGKSGPNAVKEAIGDALRNAAMRFGAALDLWAKSDLHETAAAAAEAEQLQPAAPNPQQRPGQQNRGRPQQRNNGARGRQQRPAARRDYAAEARAAETLEQVQAIYRSAAAAGASAEYLDMIRGIGEQLAAGEEQTEPAPQQRPAPPDRDDAAAAERAAWFEAERELRVAAEAMGLHNVDEEFYRSYRVKIGDAPIAKLKDMTSHLRGTRGAA